MTDTTFADWETDEPDDGMLLLVWLAEVADALAEFGHPGED